MTNHVLLLTLSLFACLVVADMHATGDSNSPTCDICSGGASPTTIYIEYHKGPGAFLEVFLTRNSIDVLLFRKNVNEGQMLQVRDESCLGGQCPLDGVLKFKLWTFVPDFEVKVMLLDMRCDGSRPLLVDLSVIPVSSSEHAFVIAGDNHVCPFDPSGTLPPIATTAAPTTTAEPATIAPGCLMCSGSMDHWKDITLVYSCLGSIGQFGPFDFGDNCGAWLDIYYDQGITGRLEFFQSQLVTNGHKFSVHLPSAGNGLIKFQFASITQDGINVEHSVTIPTDCNLKIGQKLYIPGGNQWLQVACPLAAPPPTPEPTPMTCQTAFAAPTIARQVSNRCFSDLSNGRVDDWGWSVPTPSVGGSATLPLYANAVHCDLNRGSRVGQVVVRRTSVKSVRVRYEPDVDWHINKAYVSVGRSSFPFGDQLPPFRSSWSGFAAEASTATGVLIPIEQTAKYIIVHAIGGSSDCVPEVDLDVTHCDICQNGVPPVGIYLRYHGPALSVIESLGHSSESTSHLGQNVLSDGDTFFVSNDSGAIGDYLELHAVVASGSIADLLTDHSVKFATSCSEPLRTGRVLIASDSVSFVIEGDVHTCPVPGIDPPDMDNECDLCGPGDVSPLDIFLSYEGEYPFYLEVYRQREVGRQLLLNRQVDPREVVRVRDLSCAEGVPDDQCRLDPVLEFRVYETVTASNVLGVADVPYKLAKLDTSCFFQPTLTTGTLLAIPESYVSFRVAGDSSVCPFGLTTRPPTNETETPDHLCGDFCTNGEVPSQLFMQVSMLNFDGAYVEFYKESFLGILAPTKIGGGLMQSGTVFPLKDSSVWCDLLNDGDADSPGNVNFIGNGATVCDLSPTIHVTVWSDASKTTELGQTKLDTSCNSNNGKFQSGASVIVVPNQISFVILGASADCPPLASGGPTPSPAPTATPPSEPCTVCETDETPSTLYVRYEGGDEGFVKFIRMRPFGYQVVSSGALAPGKIFLLRDDACYDNSLAMLLGSCDLSNSIEIKVWRSESETRLTGKGVFSTLCNDDEIRPGAAVQMGSSSHAFSIVGDSLSCADDVTLPPNHCDICRTDEDGDHSPPSKLFLKHTDGSTIRLRVDVKNGGEIFDFRVAADQVFSLERRGRRLNPSLVFKIGTTRQELHTSCSEPLVVGQVISLAGHTFTIVGDSVTCIYATPTSTSVPTTAVATSPTTRAPTSPPLVETGSPTPLDETIIVVEETAVPRQGIVGGAAFGIFVGVAVMVALLVVLGLALARYLGVTSAQRVHSVEANMAQNNPLWKPPKSESGPLPGSDHEFEMAEGHGSHDFERPVDI